MKNKRLVQEQRKREVRATILARKRTPEIKSKLSFLIVTEGQNTEPSYFNFLKTLGNHSVEIIGMGFDPLALVNHALALSQSNRYDQVWCVFDRDEHEHFTNSIRKAKKNGMHVAYSNQAFEYWLLLHFEDHQGGAMHRSEYTTKINRYLKDHDCSYSSKKLISQKTFSILQSIDPKNQKPRVQMAIERAIRILAFHADTPAELAASSTTVHLLVEELMREG
jgi:RloB-like protein